MSTDANATRRAQVASYFVDANLEGEPREVLSPSGRYRLVIRTYRTTPGRWSYSRGTVVRVADGGTVCDLQRNLSTFHHSFVTKDGREYLISGRSYMSQTIVDLDRGVEHEPEGDQYDGSAFCWASSYLSPDGNTLAVDGCIWACPYEIRFFDFTDPSRGWPELRAAHVDDPSDRQRPTWIDATTIDCYQSDADSEPQERTRLERRGDEMVVLEHWISPPEQARRAERARVEAEQDAWWAHFRSTDPMFLRLRDRVRAHHLPGDTLDHLCGDRRVVQYFRRESPKASADLRWDIDARTLTLQLYTPAGNRDRELTFEHSVEGIDACMDVLADVFR